MPQKLFAMLFRLFPSHSFRQSNGSMSFPVFCMILEMGWDFCVNNEVINAYVNNIKYLCSNFFRIIIIV